MHRLRLLVVTTVAVLGAAVGFGAQVVLAERLAILRPFQVAAANTSDESVYYHEFLVEWFAATGVVLGVLLACAVARGSSRPATSGRRQLGLALAATVGVASTVPAVAAVLRATEHLPYPEYAARIHDNLVGLGLLGAGLGMVASTLLALPAVRYGSAVRYSSAAWIGWIWLVFAYRLVLNPIWGPPYSLDPLGFVRLPEPSNNEGIRWAGVGLTLLPVAALAWWSARRGDRWAPAAGLIGPVVVFAAYLVGLVRLPLSGDHYGLGDDLGPWLLVALLGTGVAVGSSAVGRRGRHRTAVPTDN
jgi:hypothetical protein